MRFGSLVLVMCAVFTGAGASALADDEAPEAPLERQLATLVTGELSLRTIRAQSPDCDAGCILPSEATRRAFEAGEGAAQQGRFLLDIRSGGQSLNGALGRLFFVSSRANYAEVGTLTIAFEPDALYDLLRRARVCNSDIYQPGQITVRACRESAYFDLNMFTMMQRLSGRRIVVDGEARLQWIDARYGARPREGDAPGYYQVWVQVDDADQVTFVYGD